MTAKKHRKNIYAVDLFCGVGGLTHGLGQAGIAVKAGVDNDPTCEYAYTENNRDADFILGDVGSISPDAINGYYKNADIKVLVGCAPCQPFSAHTRKNKGKMPPKEKGNDCSLLLHFARLVEECNPDIVSIENVPGLMRHDSFHDFLKVLDGLRYKYDHPQIVFCPEYGIPQTRRRLVLLASKLGEIKLAPPPPKTKPPTVGAYIKDLPPIQHGGRSANDSCHVALKLSDLNLARVKQSKPGGSSADWDEEIVSPCHTKAHYPAPYGRMRWDLPAPTITTQFCYYSTGRFGHPEQNRAISLREGALLQTFPKKYKFQNSTNPLMPRQIARHIGNAVPVELGKAIGRSIREHLK